MESLRILLEVGGLEAGEAERLEMAETKNKEYLNYISKLDPSEILPGARRYLELLRDRGVKIALGSASKNAAIILSRLSLTGVFDAVIDGTKVSQAKPHPEVFLTASEALGLKPCECVVFEDAVAGVQAGKAAGCRVVGIGPPDILHEADRVIVGLYELIE